MRHLTVRQGIYCAIAAALVLLTILGVAARPTDNRKTTGRRAAAGATLRLEPVADAYVSRSDLQTNFGSAAKLRFYSDGRKPLFRFDLSMLPPLATVNSARFTFTIVSLSAEQAIRPLRFYVYDVAKNIVENEVTGAQFASGQDWAGPGLVIQKDYFALPYRSATLAVNEPGQYTVDITELVRALLAGGSNSVNLTVFSTDFNAGGEIYSREAEDADKHPRLEVDFSAAAPIVRVQNASAAVGPVQMDGSRSALPDGTTSGLQYAWLVDRPAYGSASAPGQQVGEGATLAFNPDRPGDYVLRLRVTNPATGDAGQAVAHAIIGLRPHPRLHVNEQLLDDLRSLRDTNNPLWTRFYSWVEKKPTYSNMEAGVATSYLLAYLMTGQRQYVDWSWELLKPRLYINKTDRSAGLTNILQSYSNDSHSAASIGGTFIAQMALLYDWGYAELAPEQRRDLIDWLNAANEYNCLRNRDGWLYLRNDGAAVTYGLAASVYATLGENPQAWQQLNWLRSRWEQAVRGLDIIGMGGAAAEGNAYGTAPTAFNLIRTANLIYYATGEDLFASHRWFRQRLLYDAFAAYPDTVGGSQGAFKWPDTMVEQSSIGGDGRRGYSWHSINLRPNGLMLARRFAGTEEADVWNWVYRQPAVDRAVSPNDCFYDLLYYSPRPALVKPARLSHYDPSMGYVYIRSDWDSPDATWISFWAGPHIDTHQHLDQGAFTIFKRRDLAPKTGHYDINVNSPHDLAYYTRTVSANSLLIGDPNETFRNFIAGMGCDGNGNGQRIALPDGSGTACIPNDGGQRTMRPFSLAVANAEEFQLYRQVFEVAKVVSFQDTGQAVLVVADLTNAYNNPRYTTQGNAPKVNKVYRRLAYLRDADLLLIADTVESSNPAFEKKWLLHSLEQLQVGGQVETIDAGESVHTGVNEARVVVDGTDPSDKYQVTTDLRQGYAALLIKTLFPNAFRYRRVGGRDPSETVHPPVYPPDAYNLNAQHYHVHIKDFWVKDYSEGVLAGHKSANWVPKSPNETATVAYIPVFGPGYGRWRLEIEATGGNQTDYFLNVLKPALDNSASLSNVRSVEQADRFGAEITSGGKTYAVWFPKDTLDAPQIEDGAVQGQVRIPRTGERRR